MLVCDAVAASRYIQTVGSTEKQRNRNPLDSVQGLGKLRRDSFHNNEHELFKHTEDLIYWHDMIRS